MKFFKKAALILLSVILVSALLVACKPPTPETDDGGKLPVNSIADAKITGSYSSNIRTSYSNMRPTYNYFLNTITYQTLTTYEDGTYCFIQALVIPTALEIMWSATDAGAKSNPQRTYYQSYYGEYATEAGSGDSVNIKLTKPFRLIFADVNTSGTHLYAYDTDNWEGYKPTNVSGISAYTAASLITADQFRLANAFSDITISVNTATGGFSFLASLPIAAAAQRTLQDKPTPPASVVLGPAFRKTAFVYQSASDKSMNFIKVSNDVYSVAFQFQMFMLYEDGTYCLQQNTATLYNYWFAQQGTNFHNKDKDGNLSDIKVVTTQYFGNYTKTENLIDRALEDVNTRKTLAIVEIQATTGGIEGSGNNVLGGPVKNVSVVSTQNWTAAMGTATGKADAAAYLAQEGFETGIVYATKESFTIVVTKDDQGNDVRTVEGAPPNASIPFLRKNGNTGKMEPVR